MAMIHTLGFSALFVWLAAFVVEIQPDLVAASLAIALTWLICTPGHRRRVELERWQAGLCGQCGYDLRASTGPCPECGGRVTEIDALNYAASDEAQKSVDQHTRACKGSRGCVNKRDWSRT